ncbi:MFS general substrate transporter [Sporormia fimetaria CBS 119925]|uniref:MFS general substrate transporter n=1 Tax=Sporormia fimetaria CBS 119925 TaxID=1340428 RepID=A0A6A6VQ05_9PLEO|nr:MFS general substrate transporter [Sporormia fimetaria CBS 119925]
MSSSGPSEEEKRTSDIAELNGEAVQSGAAAADTSRLPPPPDGGLHAWLKVLGGFLIYINIWGFTLTFGAFQTYYKDHLLSSSSASAISWIGTVQAWLLILVGVLSGPLFDLGYFRSMLYVGNFLVVFGIMMLSLSTKYWQVFLSQALCMGLGAGLLYVPSLALIGIWFERRRAFAMGVVMSGIAVGGVSYILIFTHLVPSAGFPWATRAMGFIALFAALLSFPALLSGSSRMLAPRKARSLFDGTALKDRLFLIFTCCSFFTFLGYIVPYFYIPTYAKDRLGMSEEMALYTLVMSVGASFFGRLAGGIMGHYLGSIFSWMLCALTSGILSLCWVVIEDKATFIAFAVLWGFFSAGLVTLPSAAFASICPDLSRLGTRLGMSWSVSSVASLIGAPIAGALLRTKNGRTDYLGVQLWSGAFLMFGALWLGVLWVLTVRFQNKGWRV